MEKGKITFTSVLVFVQVGALLWCTAGIITGAWSFTSAGQITTNRSEAKQDFTDNYVTPPYIKTGGAWALCGGLAGLMILLSFTSRPKEEYFTDAPPLPMILCKPKSFAEAKTLPTGLFLSILGGILLPMFFLSKLTIPDTIVMRSPAIRVIIGCLTTLTATSFILPISLWLITKIIASGSHLGSSEGDRQILGEYFTRSWKVIPIQLGQAMMLIAFLVLGSLSLYYYVIQQRTTAVKITILAITCWLIGIVLIKVRRFHR